MVIHINLMLSIMTETSRNAMSNEPLDGINIDMGTAVANSLQIQANLALALVELCRISCHLPRSFDSLI